jgi:hypothetical protein
MGGAEVAAPQAGAAEVHPDRHDNLSYPVKDAHGTQVDAGAAFAAEAFFDVHLDGEGPGGTDLQRPSHLPAFRPGLAPGRGRDGTKKNFLFFRIKMIRFSPAWPGVSMGVWTKLQKEWLFLTDSANYGFKSLIMTYSASIVFFIPV